MILACTFQNDSVPPQEMGSKGGSKLSAAWETAVDLTWQDLLGHRAPRSTGEPYACVFMVVVEARHNMTTEIPKEQRFRKLGVTGSPDIAARCEPHGAAHASGCDSRRPRTCRNMGTCKSRGPQKAKQPAVQSRFPAPVKAPQTLEAEMSFAKNIEELRTPLLKWKKPSSQRPSHQPPTIPEAHILPAGPLSLEVPVLCTSGHGSFLQQHARHEVLRGSSDNFC